MTARKMLNHFSKEEEERKARLSSSLHAHAFLVKSLFRPTSLRSDKHGKKLMLIRILNEMLHGNHDLELILLLKFVRF